MSTDRDKWGGVGTGRRNVIKRGVVKNGSPRGGGTKGWEGQVEGDLEESGEPRRSGFLRNEGRRGVVCFEGSDDSEITDEGGMATA